MDKRQILHGLLSQNFPGIQAYYRPSGNIFLEKPCIVYEKTKIKPEYSSNVPFVYGKEYKVSFLSVAPEGMDIEPIFLVPDITVVTHNSFVSEDIVHDVFTIVLK